MLITTNNRQSPQYQSYSAQDPDYKNPFIDRLEGHECMEVHDRLERYTDTYDNSEYDRNPAVGIIAVVDSSGDASVGANMRFQGNRHTGVYEEVRFNTNKAGDIFSVRRLNFTPADGKIVVTQAADRDGDKSEEFYRQTVVNPATGQIENVIER